MTTVGRGVARRHPADPPVPEIGDELAVSRALQDLAHRLHEMVSHDLASQDLLSQDFAPLVGSADQARV
jgi:hypothetical protein